MNKQHDWKEYLGSRTNSKIKEICLVCRTVRELVPPLSATGSEHYQYSNLPYYNSSGTSSSVESCTSNN